MSWLEEVGRMFEKSAVELDGVLEQCCSKYKQYYSADNVCVSVLRSNI